MILLWSFTSPQNIPCLLSIVSGLEVECTLAQKDVSYLEPRWPKRIHRSSWSSGPNFEEAYSFSTDQHQNWIANLTPLRFREKFRPVPEMARLFVPQNSLLHFAKECPKTALCRRSLNYPFREDQTLQTYLNFEGISYWTRPLFGLVSYNDPCWVHKLILGMVIPPLMTRMAAFSDTPSVPFPEKWHQPAKKSPGCGLGIFPGWKPTQLFGDSFINHEITHIIHV